MTSTEYLRYDKMVEGALRGVVRDALTQVAERGLPDSHHFYLTFRTGYPGVKIPDYLRAQYPGEMTIVLQYQFFGLDVQQDLFAVTLSFNNQHERLVIPFSAITTFADPSVNFALQFQPLSALDDEEMEDGEEEVGEQFPAPLEKLEKAAEPVKPTTEQKRGEVVALDAFRKK